ncbi:MAG: ATP-binding protein [Tepidisphaeraceae bacterium]
MLKRARRRHISLAAKCQFLFGAAVAVIIFAALLVPWQRMEQLTEQLNEKAAATVATTVVAEHISRAHAPQSWTLGTIPTTRPVAAPTTLPLMIDGQTYQSPRILGLAAINSPARLTRFENSALHLFLREPDRKFHFRHYETSDGVAGYRYAEPLYTAVQCVSCHQAVAQSRVEPPTTRPASLLGIVSVDIPSQISNKQLLLNRIFLLTAGLLAGSLAIVIFYLITTRLILQPVRVLQETAEKVSEGDLNIRSDINTGDEFQVLSETFNTMLVNLKASSDQLRAVNKSLDMKLGQLAESNVALYESNRLKSEFLANVSHELRTPLNSILGFAELLKDQINGAEPKAIRYIQNILSSGNNLLVLINDLLDLAKIEAGRMEVRSEQLSVSDLFEGLTSLLKPLCEAKQISIAASIAPDVPILQTDPGKLQQVLYNFLSNAIKFSPNGEKIELSATRDAPESVRISVTDRGPGIDPEQHATIFEKFRQLDGSVTRQHGGSGLGLAISKELAQLLGGSIGVRSAPGEGANFWIVIPLTIESGAAELRGKMSLT